MADVHPESHARMVEALRAPYLRVGMLHEVKATELYGQPAVSLLLSWMEPGDDDAEYPEVHALELVIPGMLVNEVRAKFDAVLGRGPKAPGQGGGGRSSGGSARKRPRR